MELKTIKYEVRERIATITLSRPNRMNAWTGRMHTEYRWALLQADNDKHVGAIILTGEGRGFCVGADSQALEGHVARGGYDPGTPAEIPEPGFGVRPEFDVNFAYHFGLSKPIVVAINGAAAGVGLVLACYCDIRFAAPGIKLTTAHGKLNLPAEYGLSWLLPRQIGLAWANDLLLTSRVFLSEEAAQIGLINRVIAADLLMSETRAYVKSMIDTVSPGSLKASRQQIYADQHRGVDEAVKESESLLQAMMKQDDYQEGVAAFLEKRNPRWSV